MNRNEIDTPPGLDGCELSFADHVLDSGPGEVEIPCGLGVGVMTREDFQIEQGSLTFVESCETGD